MDVAQALTATEVKAPAKPTPPEPPRPGGSSSTTVPGKPRLVIKDRQSASGANLRQRILDAQEQARKDITGRLRRFYDTEISRFEFDQNRARAAAEIEAYENANLRIRQRFDKYAIDRMPIYTELTLLAGFPDQNPESKPPENPLPPAFQKRFDQTLALRAQLKEIDRTFHEDVDQILAGVQDLVAAQVTALRLRVEQFKDQLDRRAADEARAQVRMTVDELGLELIEPKDLVLPATSPQSVTVAAEPPFRPAPDVPSAGILQGKADRERLLRHELGIWLGLNRYSLATDAKGGRDLTTEFLKWRSQFEVGH